MPKDSLLPPVHVAEISSAALDAFAKALSPVIAEALAHSANSKNSAPQEALPAPQAAKFIGIGKSKFHEIKKEDPSFPAPVYVGRRPFYLVTELRAWRDCQRDRKGG